MKKTITQWSMVVALAVGSLLNAQVGINAGELSKGYPHEMAEDAILHVENKKGENKGVLFPSVSLTSKTDQTTTSNGAVTKGLMVWNDGKAGFAEGYYAWDGTQWQKLAVNYTGSNGVEVTGDNIQLDKTTRDKLAKVETTSTTVDNVDTNVKSIRDKQIVTWGKLNLTGRRLVRGVSGSVEIRSPDDMRYQGTCQTITVEHYGNDGTVNKVFSGPSMTIWVLDGEFSLFKHIPIVKAIAEYNPDSPSTMGRIIFESEDSDAIVKEFYKMSSNYLIGGSGNVSKTGPGSPADRGLYQIYCVPINLWEYNE